MTTRNTDGDLRQEPATALKEQQGRWFEMNGRTDDRTVATRENLSMINRLPAPAREQLLEQFLATVSGQISGSLTVSSQPISDDLRQRNIDIFYRYIEYENARDYEKMEQLFHPTEFRSKTYFGNDPISPEAHTRMLRGLFRSFPDWFMVINEIISADNVAVVGLITGRGTQYEEFAGRPPRDHQIAIPTLHSIKVEDGLIIEHRHINPFEDIFANQIMAPMTEDVMAVRAQQGFDSSMAERAYRQALEAGADESKLGELRALVEMKRRQCQVLLKGTLRRCSMIAPDGEIYCRHHQQHGYGIDGLE